MQPFSHAVGRVVFALGLTFSLLVASPANGDSPLLANRETAPGNARWYQPQGSNEVTWIGGEGDGDPVLVLQKEPIAQNELLLHIRSDADQLTLKSGDETVTVELRPGHRVLLRGQQRNPGVEVDGRELEAARGRWIRLFLIAEDPAVAVTFKGATFANVTLEQPTLRPTIVLPGPDGSSAAPTTDAEGPVLEVEQQASPNLPEKPMRAAPGGAEAVAGTRGRPRVIRLDSPANQPVERADPDVPVRVRTTGPVRFDTPQAGIDRELNPENRWRLNLDAGIDYLTAYHYRGFGRDNQGLILQPWTETALTVFESRTPFALDYVDLVGGLRSSHQWGPSGGEIGEKWVEFQWYGGIEAGVFDRWRLGLAYVNVESIATAFRDVHQFDFWVGFDDRDPKFDWSLQPYALLSMEYEKQSDGGWLSQANSTDPRFDTGAYVELGIRPQFELFNLHLDEPVTLTVPARVGLSLSDYYEDTQGEDRAFGFAEIGLDLGIPIASIAAEGNRRFVWQLNTGVHLLYLGNSVRDLGRATGTSHENFEVVGKIGLSVNY